MARTDLGSSRKYAVTHFKKKLKHIILVRSSSSELGKTLSLSTLKAMSGDKNTEPIEIDYDLTDNLARARNSIDRNNLIHFPVAKGNTVNKYLILEKLTSTSYRVLAENEIQNFTPSRDDIRIVDNLYFNVEAR